MTTPVALDLIVMAKEPQPGRVKTRLIPALGAEGAARLHRAFVGDILRRAVERHPQVTLCHAPDDHPPVLASLVTRHSARMTPQGDGDLGARMARALHTQLVNTERGVLLIGTDSPTLPDAMLIDAAAQLDRADLVFGPSCDGGYYLVGATPTLLADWSRVVEALFCGIDWGSDRVLAQSLARGRKAGLSVALAPGWYDVDRPDDLTLLRRHLSDDPSGLPDTAAALSHLSHRQRSV